LIVDLGDDDPLQFHLDRHERLAFLKPGARATGQIGPVAGAPGYNLHSNLSGIIELFDKMGQAREEQIAGGGIGFCGKFPRVGTGKTKWKVYH